MTCHLLRMPRIMTMMTASLNWIWKDVMTPNVRGHLATQYFDINPQIHTSSMHTIKIIM